MNNWLTTEQASDYSGFTAGTMRTWRSQGYGPQYVKTPGGRIRYRYADLDAWITNGAV